MLECDAFDGDRRTELPVLDRLRRGGGGGILAFASAATGAGEDDSGGVTTGVATAGEGV